jgi:aspartyl-tRNA(Asn)/glutamyl-tRNA(Gln) amidotransferase subunit A
VLAKIPLPTDRQSDAGPTSRTEDLCTLSVSRLAGLIERRQVSPVEIVEACLARIASCDGQVNAFITVTADRALRQAREAEREISAGRYRGPLHGVPFGLKDVIETAGIRTTAHSRLLENNVPLADAAVVEKLCRAGAILVGKLATHEFAHGGPSFDLPWPPARNPWDLERFTGGSSSGSGAAVAARFVPAALGTDTGGSVRIPAALCGVTGLKPTYGRVSRRGIIPNSYSFDHGGPIARTAQDCALLLEAIAGHDEHDPGSSDRPVPHYRASLRQGLRGMRVGVVRHFWERDLPVAHAVRAAMEASLRVLTDLGARIETVRLRPLQEYTDVKNVISETELFAVHQHDLIERAADYGEMMRSRILAFCVFQAVDYVQAQRQRSRMLDEMQPLYERYDVFVNAGPGPAPLLADSRKVGLNDKWEKPKLPAAFSVTGGPALVLCNGFDDSGLPLAMEIAAKPFDEEAVLRVAHAYQQATDWHRAVPPLAPGAAAPQIDAPVEPDSTPAIDAATRDYVDMMAARAGLALSAAQKRQLYEAAPHALAMAARIERMHERGLEPANGFRFPHRART